MLFILQMLCSAGGAAHRAMLSVTGTLFAQDTRGGACSAELGVAHLAAAMLLTAPPLTFAVAHE